MNIFRKNDLFDLLFTEVNSCDDGKMNCDIYDDENTYNVVIDLPGYTKDDIKIEADKGYLKIKASRTKAKDDEDKKYIRRERVYGSIERAFYLGEIEEDKITAKFEDGCLELTVPKKKEIETKKIVEIE